MKKVLQIISFIMIVGAFMVLLMDKSVSPKAIFPALIVLVLGGILAYFTDLISALMSLGKDLTAPDDSWLIGTSKEFSGPVTVRGYRSLADMTNGSPDYRILGTATNPKELRQLEKNKTNQGPYNMLGYFQGDNSTDWTNAVLGLGAHIDQGSGHIMYQGEILD